MRIILESQCGILWLLICFGGCATEGDPGNSVATRVGTQAKRVESERTWTNQAAAWGLDHCCRSGGESRTMSILEVTGGGVAVIDFDADGREDLFLPGGGTLDEPRQSVSGLPCALYRNLGKRMRQVSTSSRAAINRFYSLGASRGDIDADGWPDLIVTGYGGASVLNNQGDGTFLEKRLPVSPTEAFFVASAAADLNGDGLDDLYLSNYCDWSWSKHPYCVASEAGMRQREICSPRSFKGLADCVLVTDGTGGWLDAAEALGLAVPADRLSMGMGVLVGDLTNDHHLDIYVANDGQPNFLFVGDGNGRYTEQAIARGVAVGDDARPTGSMGVTATDLEGNGVASLIVTNFALQPLAVYQNSGKGRYHFASRTLGVNDSGKSFVSWGVVSPDLNGDGKSDLIICNANVFRHGKGLPQPGQVYLNCEGKLQECGQALIPEFSAPHAFHGLATADFNFDGIPDFVAGGIDEPPGFFLSSSARPGREVSMVFVGTTSPRVPCGLTYEFMSGKALADGEFGGKPRLSKKSQLWAGGSYASSSSEGIPAESTLIGEIRVRWPTGRIEFFKLEQTLGPRQVFVEGKGNFTEF